MTSTAISSTVVRQTPSLTVPSTQNTAPVLDFRCLYTHDLRRKAKRWQDGILRFHTFNKRVMVYDVPRNFIGDTHWREDGTVQDGDELKLDKGILIQVGEATGSMEQDLTELLEKRKKAPEVPGKAQVSPPTPLVTASTAKPALVRPSQLRPKSLNALLGTPKGRIGRASLPTKSPYEAREETEVPSFETCRPAKRQRIEISPARQAKSNASLRSRRPASPKAAPIELKDPGIRENPAVDKQTTLPHIPIGKEYERWPSVAAPVQRVTLPRMGQTEGAGLSSRANGTSQNHTNKVPEADKNVSSSRQQSTSRPRTEKALIERSDQGARTPLRRDSTSSAPRVFHNATDTASARTETRSENDDLPINEPPKERLKLQMATRKPRKKLMYKDLLPPDERSRSQSTSAPAKARRNSHNQGTLKRSKKQLKDPLAASHEEESNRLKARLRKHHEKDKRMNHDRNNPMEEDESSLFLTQDDDDDFFSPNTHHRTKERIPPPTTSKPSLPNTTQINLFHPPRPPSNEPPQLSIPKPTSSVHETDLTLAQMDEILLSKQNSPQQTRKLATPKQIPAESPDRAASPILIPSTPPEPAASPDLDPDPPINIPPETPHPESPPSPENVATHATNLNSSETSKSIQPPLPNPDQPPLPLQKNQKPFNPPTRVRVRSPLKKAISDLTTTTTTQPPAAKQNSPPAPDKPGPEATPLWSKEAWDLFGCGRDGVECTYEEFKRKEGLM